MFSLGEHMTILKQAVLELAGAVNADLREAYVELETLADHLGSPEEWGDLCDLLEHVEGRLRAIADHLRGMAMIEE
jgi:hypothetical protein